MSLLINRLCRCAFTHADKGISSLSIHCTKTALCQIWINLSSALHSFFLPKPVSYLPAVLQCTWEWSSVVQKIPVCSQLKCRVFSLQTAAYMACMGSPAARCSPALVTERNSFIFYAFLTMTQWESLRYSNVCAYLWALDLLVVDFLSSAQSQANCLPMFLCFVLS